MPHTCPSVQNLRYLTQPPRVPRIYLIAILNPLRNMSRFLTEFEKSYRQRSPSLSASSTNTNRLFTRRRIMTPLPRVMAVVNESLDLLVLYWEVFLLNLVENLQAESGL